MKQSDESIKEVVLTEFMEEASWRMVIESMPTTVKEVVEMIKSKKQEKEGDRRGDDKKDEEDEDVNMNPAGKKKDPYNKDDLRHLESDLMSHVVDR